MLADKALELIKELDRSRNSQLPPFSEDTVRKVLEEINTLLQQNVRDIEKLKEGDSSLVTGVHLRHAALERNKRCLLAYLYNRLERLRGMRWQCGGVLPPEVTRCLCDPESAWFASYSRSLASYQRSLGDGLGLDLSTELKPPKTLYVEVRALEDYGELELEEGEVVVLEKDSTHFLPLSVCEGLIRQGVLRHVA